MLLTQNNYHGACHCRCQRQLGRHRLEVQDDRFCCCCGCRMASDFHCQALQEGDGIRACSQADGITGICSRLQDMQRKGCSRMPRVQGDRQEQEEWKHFREMEVLRLPRIWAQELPQLWQRRPHTRAERGEMIRVPAGIHAFRFSLAHSDSECFTLPPLATVWPSLLIVISTTSSRCYS